jgi:hypothetical protein
MKITNFLEGRPSIVSEFMSDTDFEAWQGSQENVVLTDNFVPVEGMLAPLYLDARVSPR